MGGNTTNNPMGSGSSGGGALFRNILARKASATTTTSAGSSTNTGIGAVGGVPSTPIVNRLRKIRKGTGSGGSNVMLTKSELSVTDVLDRISESLMKNSIRFTLKR